MKKITLLAIIAVFMISCSKDVGTPIPSNKTYPVKFAVGLNFNAVDGPLSKLDTINNITDTISYNDSIYYQYMVYTTSGALVKQIKGKGSTITDQLSAGYYKIAIIGATDANLLNYNMQVSNYFNDVVLYSKAYYTSFNYVVDSVSTTATTKNVQLNRMWGELHLDIIDRATCIIPSNVQSFAVRTVGASPSFFISNENGRFDSLNVNIVSKSVNEFRNSYAIKCLESFATQSNVVNVYLDVFYTDSISTPSKHLLLTSVPVKKGVKTTLKGNLGDILNNPSINTESIKLILKQDWTTETVKF